MQVKLLFLNYTISMNLNEGVLLMFDFDDSSVMLSLGAAVSSFLARPMLPGAGEDDRLLRRGLGMVMHLVIPILPF